MKVEAAHGATKSSTLRPAREEGRSARLRSRVTNNLALLLNVDGRSPWARRFRDLVEAHMTDLGGYASASEGERALVRRAATMIVDLEQLESKFAAQGEATDAQMDRYQRVTNALRRCLETLAMGLPRKMVDVTPQVPVATPSFVRELLDRYGDDPAGFKVALRKLDRHTRTAVKLHLLPILYPHLVERLGPTQQVNLDSEVDADLYREVQEIDDPFGLFEADDEAEADNGHPVFRCAPATVQGAASTTMQPTPQNSPTELDQDRGGQQEHQPNKRPIERIRY